MSATSTQTLREAAPSGEPRHVESILLQPLSSDSIQDPEPPANAVEAIPDGGYGWNVVGACSFLLFWINGYTTTWGVLQAAILQSPRLHVDVSVITFVGSLYMACMVAFSPVSVRFIRAFGVRYTCLGMVLLFGIGLICTSLTLEHLEGLFCIAGALVGIATSVLYTATNSLPTQWFSGKLGTANGLVKAGGGIGATVLPIVAQSLIDRVGLAWTFRALGVMVLVAGIPCALLLQERVRIGQAAHFQWSLLRNPTFLPLALAGAIAVFSLFVPPFFLPLFARTLGLSASTGAGLVAGFGAATAVGRLLGGWVCDRIGAFNMLTITALVNGLSMLAIWPISASLPPLFVFALVNGCANGSFFVGLPTAVAALDPASAAASISLMTAFWTPGYLLGAPLAGFLIQSQAADRATSIEPYRAAIFYAAGTGVLAAMLIVLSRLRLEKKLLKKV